ncbi:hypothetical protein GX48_07050 [Paracoccidioides brasiliensis]|nr:hypothetical protein GX48_07050 [Paracoccidioides brasiliensis]
MPLFKPLSLKALLLLAMTLGAIANPFPNPQNDAVQCGTNTCNNGDATCAATKAVVSAPLLAGYVPSSSANRKTSNAVLQSAGEARSAVIRAVEFALPLVEGVPNKPASLPPRNAARRPALLAKCAATPAVESALLLVGLVPNKSVRILRRQSMICDMN